MNLKSLKLRLFLAAVVFVLGALLLYWLVLAQVFERHVSERLYGELEAHLDQLTAIVEISDSSEILVEEILASSRFNKPFGGLYWQISSPELQSVTSRSLWDQTLTIAPADTPRGTINRYDKIAFNDGYLIAIDRSVQLDASVGSLEARMIVAMDRQDLELAIAAFGNEVARLVGLLALFLLVAAGAQIIVGLRPLSVLRDKLNELGNKDDDTHATQLTGSYPTEVKGLVDELNTLLLDKNEMVDKARAQASDLAHGLKTPLAIMAAESRTIESDGQQNSAKEINTQIDTMNRHIERQLVKARMGSIARVQGEGIEVEPVLAKFVKTFRKLPSGDDLEYQLSVEPGLRIKMELTDFEEVIGNLLDNANKWARKVIQITAVSSKEGVCVSVEDDGQGVADIDISTITQRGGRLDENAPGTGLGLAIVGDVVEAYGGELAVERAESGGLCVRFWVG